MGLQHHPLCYPRQNGLSFPVVLGVPLEEVGEGHESPAGLGGYCSTLSRWRLWSRLQVPPSRICSGIVFSADPSGCRFVHPEGVLEDSESLAGDCLEPPLPAPPPSSCGPCSQQEPEEALQVVKCPTWSVSLPLRVIPSGSSRFPSSANFPQTLHPAGSGCWGGWGVCWEGEDLPPPLFVSGRFFFIHVLSFSLSLFVLRQPFLFCSSVLCDDLERFTDFSSKPPFCPSQKAPCIGQSSLEKQNQCMYIHICVLIGLAKKFELFHKIE